MEDFSPKHEAITRGTGLVGNRGAIRISQTTAPEKRSAGIYPGAAYAQRQAGMKAGTYVVTCDDCRGTGIIRIGQRPPEPCYKCAGEGVLTIHGEREDDSMLRAQPSWTDVGYFMVLAVIVAIILCEVVVWKAGAIHH